jgi:hypothetical protein
MKQICRKSVDNQHLINCNNNERINFLKSVLNSIQSEKKYKNHKRMLETNNQSHKNLFLNK